jgi:hypothetical protein
LRNIKALKTMKEDKSPEMPLESDIEASIEGQSDEKTSCPQGGPQDFPEGGLRAWSVAIGCAGVLFSTFGYVNAFGSVFLLHASQPTPLPSAVLN